MIKKFALLITLILGCNVIILQGYSNTQKNLKEKKLLDYRLKVEVGEAWSQIYAIRHETVIATNKQSKQTVFAIDNPLGIIHAKLDITYCDRFFVSFALFDYFGNNGIVTLTDILQETPFDILTNLDGPLTTNAFTSLNFGGFKIHIRDEFDLGFGAGFLYSNVRRSVKYVNTDFANVYCERVAAPIIDAFLTIRPNDKTIFTLIYHYGIGTLRLRSISIPDYETTFYCFPRFSFSELNIEYSYRFNENYLATLGIAWLVNQNTRDGQVDFSALSASQFSNARVTVLRYQYFLLRFGVQFAY